MWLICLAWIRKFIVIADRTFIMSGNISVKPTSLSTSVSSISSLSSSSSVAAGLVAGPSSSRSTAGAATAGSAAASFTPPTLPPRDVEYFKEINYINDRYNQSYKEEDGFRRRPQYCLNCGKAFSFSINLERHLEQCGKIDKNQNKYSCEECEATFTLANNLRRHKHSVHQERKHRCDKCQKVFSRSDILAVHKESRKCKSCARKFLCSSAFNQHKSKCCKSQK